MILILSDDSDHSTTEVCFWLDRLNGNYRVISSSDIYNQLTISFPSSKRYLPFDSVYVIWNRRWSIGDFVPSEYTSNKEVDSDIRKNLISELNTLDRYIWNNFDNAKWLDKFQDIYVNKLKILDLAHQIGFKIPNGLLTTCKEELIKFKNKYSNIICKSISDNIAIQTDEYFFYGYTNEISDGILKELPDSFFPSFFQESIDKQVEIRVFYLFGDIYAMAIFSQTDEKTKADFRRYNDKNPNRNVPFNLPTQIEDLIHEFMKRSGLNSASFDFILSNEDEYVFLEVNPVGQFGMVSKPCNYNLEKKIAEKLIEYDCEK